MTRLKTAVYQLRAGAPVTTDHAVQLARAVLSLARQSLDRAAARNDQRVQLARAVLKRVNTVALDEFARAVLDKSIWAIRHNHGWPDSSWPPREVLAVALVLDDRRTLSSAGYTVAEAHRVLAEGMASPPKSMSAWIQQIRDALDTDE